MLQVHLLCARHGDFQKRHAHPLRKGCGPCNACCHDKPGTCRAGTLYRSTLAHIVNTCLSSCWPSGSFLDTTLSGTKPCYRDVQALPRRVLGPSVAPPARGLPSRAGSATPTPAAPPPGEYLVRQNLQGCAAHASGFSVPGIQPCWEEAHHVLCIRKHLSA